MTRQEELVRALTAQLVMREGRMTERQMMLLRWTQYDSGKITMFSGREVQLSEPARRGVESLKKEGRFIFGRTPLFLPEEGHHTALKILVNYFVAK